MKARLLLLLLFFVSPALAQDYADRADRAQDRISALAERAEDLGDDLSSSHRSELRRAARRLQTAADEIGDADYDTAADRLDEAEDMIDEVLDELRDDGHDSDARRVSRLLASVRDEEDRLDDLTDRDSDRRDRNEDFGDRAEEWGERWGERWEKRAEAWAERFDDDDEFRDDAEDEWDDRRTQYRRDRSDWRRHRFRSYAPSFVGDFGDRWPFMETSTYRPLSSIRYNRVDGLTLGFRRKPMDWDSYDRARIFGQVGRSFGLDEWRYEAGAEARLGHSYSTQEFDLKVGGAYRVETGTDDLWKAGWAENTSAAFLFRTDFFDYFQTEGYTLYAVARVTPLLQASVAYRSDDYTSLSQNATWSLFGGDSFRSNPGIDEGRMQSVVVTVDGGKIRGLRWIPSGIAFRGEAEFGKSSGGDFNFNRYVGDVRAYIHTGRDMGLSLRARGGTSTGELPLQKAFTLGGAGSVRAYPQNIFRGTEMLLVNAEMAFYDVDPFDGILDGVTLFALADAGWTNGGSQKDFSMDDVIPSAGFGIALDDRQIRFELAWPLRDMGTGLEPTLWLRLNPTF
jgi:hypothetical protein